MMSHVPLPGAPIRMLVPFTTFGNGAPVLSNYKFILASPPVSSAAIPTRKQKGQTGDGLALRDARLNDFTLVISREHPEIVKARGR